ncbi:hypothetical protein MVEN_00969800 [Mycena venus]|uniref:F-box domain-containing protein n=1 Tax=Mycena venus TaxID=2733690 RepID=A0A8H6YDL3_9AGAR|nr:hypothetical protein MVEN_00969800 [Mycena venus]
MLLADSPFADRLNTNYVPTDSEVLEILHILVDPADELARLDAEIKDMEIAISRLKERRALLKVPIDAHKALISPMRRIPQDVLLEIFFSCLPLQHNALIDPAEAPLILGRICRDWRRVAYSTPMLWCFIHIPSPNYRFAPPTILSKLGRIVEAWLERTATCALDISLNDTTFFVDVNIEIHPLISQLLPVSRRLRHLALSGDAEFLRPLLRLGAKDLPLLKSIRIDSNINQIFSGSADALQLPSLEDVSLRITESVDPLSFPLKWAQMTGLSLQCYSSWSENGPEGGLTIRGALEVLRRCPNLERCELRMTRADDESVDTTTSIPLLQMHTLVLTGFHFEKWIPHLVLPKLRCLQVGDVILGDTASRPPDPYMRADIDPNHFTSSSLQELFESFPMISHLRLSSTTYSQAPVALDDAFLPLFYAPHDLCPALTHFTALSFCAGFSDTAALAFVRGRMVMPTPLQQFQVRFRRPMEVDIMPELQIFISDGLKVEVQYPSVPRFDAKEGLYGPQSLY